MTGVLNRLHPGLRKKPQRTDDAAPKPIPIRWVLGSLCHPQDGIEVVLTGDPPLPRIDCARCGAIIAEIAFQRLTPVKPGIWPLPSHVQAKIYHSTVRPIDRLLAARALAAAQIEDPFLWSIPHEPAPTEDRLREALRRIHAALEGERLPWPPLPGEKP